MSKRKSQKKYFFCLKFKSSLSEIHNKYNIVINSSTTLLEDYENISFHDEFNKIHNCCISILNFSNVQNYCCFWDRNEFSTKPFGCPLEYKPKSVTRTYNSEISKDTFTVRESISINQILAKDINLSINQSPDYYETDGIFCSPECMLAFAIENKNIPLYEKSVCLIHKLCDDIFHHTIIPAPSWRLLEKYGGILTIEKFREGFSQVDFEFKSLYKPCFKPIGFIYEEKIKL